MSKGDRTGVRISVDALAFFVLVANSGSIAAAARSWNISPSMATRKVAALESALASQLFDRTTRQVLLTDAGRRALIWANEVIDGHAGLADELGLMRQQLAGLIRIIANEYLITTILPEFLADFSLRFPDIRFALAVTDSAVASDYRDYDVAIFSGQLPDSSLKGVRIRSFRRILCASPAYLKRHPPIQRLDELASHACLVHRQAQDGVWVFRRHGRLVRQRINPVVLSESYLPLMQLARCGMGIIRVSRGAVRADLEAGRLVEFLGDSECVNQDGSRPATGAVFPGRREVTRTRVFIAELTRYLRNLPG